MKVNTSYEVTAYHEPPIVNCMNEFQSDSKKAVRTKY